MTVIYFESAKSKHNKKMKKKREEADRLAREQGEPLPKRLGKCRKFPRPFPVVVVTPQQKLVIQKAAEEMLDDYGKLEIGKSEHWLQQLANKERKRGEPPPLGYEETLQFFKRAGKLLPRGRIRQSIANLGEKGRLYINIWDEASHIKIAVQFDFDKLRYKSGGDFSKIRIRTIVRTVERLIGMGDEVSNQKVYKVCITKGMPQRSPLKLLKKGG